MNEINVEAALKLINITGYCIDHKLERAEWRKKNEAAVSSIYK